VRLTPHARFDANEIVSGAARDGWTCETSGDGDGERTSANAKASALRCARAMDGATEARLTVPVHARYGTPRNGGGVERASVDDASAACADRSGTTITVARARGDGIWDVPVGDANALGRARATHAATQLVGAACVLRAIRASRRRARTRRAPVGRVFARERRLRERA
jgi:hypothetical protein